jgi:Protein of unknown function (DUF4238)
MPDSVSKRHHYVPQFYLRQFACTEDPKKVMTLEKRGNFVVYDCKSIRAIGYQDSLHDVTGTHGFKTIENALNRAVETPFSQGRTWTKIRAGQCIALDETDLIPLYGFARHLMWRNADTLRFIEAENNRYKTGELNGKISRSEHEMHNWLASSNISSKSLFHIGALDRSIPPDSADIGMMVCRSPIPLRSSTNPTLTVSFPGNKSAFGDMFSALRTWWLSLDRSWGIFIVAGGPPGFSQMELPLDTAIMINRLYLVQQQHESASRFLIAEDDFLVDDLDWAGYKLESRTQRIVRFRKRG